MERTLKKYSGPETPMGSLKEMEEVIWAERRRNPKPAVSCDSCFRRFRGAPIEDCRSAFDEDEEEGANEEDA